MVDKEIEEFIVEMVKQQVSLSMLAHSAVVSEKIKETHRMIEAKILALDIAKFHELRSRCTSILKECQEFRAMMAWYKEMQDVINDINQFKNKLAAVFLP